MQEGLPPIPVICAVCQSPGADVKQTTPLCVVCRDKHVKLAVPKALKIGAIVIGLALLYTFVRTPKELAASVAWDRGDASWEAKHYVEAEQNYKLALRHFPDSISVLGRVARAADAAGDTSGFGGACDALAKKAKTDPDAAKELMEILTRNPNHK